MKDRVFFNFKAATGFGAVVDGCVAGVSEDHVKRDLIRQGLIPVRVWPERVQPSFSARVLILLSYRLGRVRAALFNPHLPFER